MTVLLTSFEPFDGAATNPSMAVVEAVATGWDRAESLATEVLPVTYGGAREQLTDALARLRPRVLVSVGLAARRHRPSLERLAVNLQDARIPDNDGHQPVDEPVVPGGPLALLTSLPVRATAARLREEGHDAEISMTAGTFVCNAVFYLGTAWAEAAPGRRAGFVHVPSGPSQASVAAVRATIDDALDLTSDLVTATGAVD